MCFQSVNTSPYKLVESGVLETASEPAVSDPLVFFPRLR